MSERSSGKRILSSSIPVYPVNCGLSSIEKNSTDRGRATAEPIKSGRI